MPGQIEVDISVMEEPDSVIRVSDLSIPDNATLLTDVEELVVRIELPRVEVEAVVVGEEGEEGVEGAEEGGAGDSGDAAEE
jgi:hypothetical protein